MAFRFKRKESLAEGFVRVGHEQLALAISALEDSSSEGVHASRRAIKHLRSLLRLFQRALPGESFARTNDKLRTIGRSLSGLRDSQVRLTAFRKVTRKLSGREVGRLQRDFLAAVVSGTSADAAKKAISGALGELQKLERHFPQVDPELGWSAIRRSLQIYYRRARKAHAAACADPSTATLHAWRRRSKDFEHHLKLLGKMDPSAMKRRLRDADHLNTLLGDERDLGLVAETLASLDGPSTDLRAQVSARIDRRRSKLQRSAFRVGSSLFFEKPSVVVADLHKRWRQWRRG
jgi:CHAD domain-containing protein